MSALQHKYDNILTDYTDQGTSAVDPNANAWKKYLKSAGTDALSGATGAVSAAAGLPIIPIAAGTLSLLDSINKNDEAQKQYEAAQHAYKVNLGLEQDAMNQTKQNQNAANAYNGSNFASETQNEIRSPYAKYLSSIAK